MRGVAEIRAGIGRGLYSGKNFSHHRSAARKGLSRRLEQEDARRRIGRN